MGGVNTNRHYARTMGFGYFNDAKGQIEITHPLLQGGIVCLLTQNPCSQLKLPIGRGLLPPRCPHRRLHRGLARRQIRSRTHHRHRLRMDHLRRRHANRRPELGLDVLCACLERDRDGDLVRHHAGLGDGDFESYVAWGVYRH